MKKFLFVIFVFMLMGGVVGAKADESVEISMSLNRDSISQSQNAILSIMVSATGQQSLPDPSLPPLPQFYVSSVGQSQSFEFLNGKTSLTVTYNYALVPQKEGTFPIRPASVVVGGKRYKSNELSLTVVKAGQAPTASSPDKAVDSKGAPKDLFLSVEVDKDTAYVDEQITMSVKYFEGIRTLSVPEYTQPHTPDFWSSQLPPHKTYYQSINNRNYLVHEWRSALFPTRPGDLEVGDARVVVTVPDRSRRRSRDPFSMFDNLLNRGLDVAVRSKPFTVTVLPLPTKSKPDDFSGGVGNYRIASTLDKTNVEVNEAISLEVKISGRGNIKSIPEPSVPEIDGFRIEKASSDYGMSQVNSEIGGTKTFEYVLIPRIPGTFTLPPVSLNYFNPESERYITVKTQPVTLTVAGTPLSADSELPYKPVVGRTINLKETDIRYIKTDDVDLEKRGEILLTSPVFVAITVIPLLALVGGVVDVRRRKKMSSDIAYARLRRANREAKKRLKHAESLLRSGSDADYYAELSGVIYQFIADKQNLSAHGLTSDRVDQILREKEVEDHLRQETLDIISLSDMGRYGGGQDGQDRGALFERARNVVVTLEGVFR